MSGIIGIIGLANAQSLTQMSHAIAHRGIDGIAFWYDDNVSMGQLLLKNNPNSDIERPFVQNDLVLLADARIDNVTAPMQSCLLDMYRKQGQDMAQQLVGDFAVAIWDKSKQQLLLIRDHSGVRPLFYVHKKGQFFAFASEPKALLALPEVSKALNQQKIGAYLMWQTDHRGYQNDTFYKEILAVRPATTLVFDLKIDSISEHFYWQPNLDRFSHLKTDQDFADAFRRYFTQAVERRTRSSYRIGAHLSGGLDSSSISVVARNLLAQKNEKLLSIHYDTDNPMSDEKRYAQAVLDTGGFEHLWVKKTKCFIQNLHFCNTILDKPDPFTIPSGLFRMDEAEYLQQNNARTLLTGHDGDTVVDSARFYLDDFQKKRHIKEFKRLYGINLSYKDGRNEFENWDNWNVSQRIEARAPEKLKRFVVGYFKEKKRAEACMLIILFMKEGLISPFVLLKESFKWLMKRVFKSKITNLKIGVIQTSFRESINLTKYAKDQTRFRFLPDNLEGEILEHFKRIHCAGIIEANEVNNFLGAKFNHDVCHPFLDKDLIELCLATPPHLRYFDGKGRGQMRLAMVGLLPHDVLQRTTKVEFTPVIRDNLLALHPSAAAIIKELGFEKYIDFEAIELMQQKLEQSEYKSFLYTSPLQRALFLSDWLDSLDKK